MNNGGAYGILGALTSADRGLQATESQDKFRRIVEHFFGTDPSLLKFLRFGQ